MNPPDEDYPAEPEPFLPGLAPVFDSLAHQAAPLLGLEPRPVILIGAMLASAIAGSALQVALPLQPHARTNVHAIFQGDGRRAAIRMLKILMSPLEEHVGLLLSGIPVNESNRRALQRELLHSEEGIAKLEQRVAALKLEQANGKSVDIEKELKQLASGLGLRYPGPAPLRRHAAALRLALRQMIITSPMELPDLAAWPTASLDGHVLDLLLEPHQTNRMLGLHPNHLGQLARFRLESCLNRGIATHRGKVAGHPRPSTLWFAEPSDVDNLFANPRCRQNRLVDPFVIVDVDEGPIEECAIPDFFGKWQGFFIGLFHLRLHQKQVKLTPDPEAWQLLDGWRHNDESGAEWFVENVLHPSLVTVAAVNACARHEDIEARSSVIINPDDVRVAIALLGPDLVKTVLRHGGSDSSEANLAPARSLEEILAKLTVKGPLDRRGLIRSFHKTTAAELEPLLKAGIEKGLIAQRDGKFAVATESTRS